MTCGRHRSAYSYVIVNQSVTGSHFDNFHSRLLSFTFDISCTGGVVSKDLCFQYTRLTALSNRSGFESSARHFLQLTATVVNNCWAKRVLLTSCETVRHKHRSESNKTVRHCNTRSANLLFCYQSESG